MPSVIPLNSEGDRVIYVSIATTTLVLRTYWTTGQKPTWTMDISDFDGNQLINGINLVPGAENVLKGQGDILNGFQMFLYQTAPDYTSDNALGTTLFCWIFSPDEEHFSFIGDPLIFTNFDNILARN